ncbi:phosphate acetyltransferase [Desulfovibrio sp. OttesenSCG-928-I05]|nr:phosphate acetyltransferase [Desulfovibrio sp. OttesenSCG-928-I05]
MAKSLFVLATEARTGQAAIVLGIMQAMMRSFKNVAFFRPVIDPIRDGAEDPNISMVRKEFGLAQSYEESYGFTRAQAMELINSGKKSALFDAVMDKCNALREKYDFVLCMGTGIPEGAEAFSFQLNSEIASNLGAPVIAVTRAHGSADSIAASGKVILDMLRDNCVDLLGAVFTQASLDQKGCDTVKNALGGMCPVWVLPEDAAFNSCPPPLDSAVALFERHFDAVALAEMITGNTPSVITPKMFESSLIERAKRHKMRIVLPEGKEERILRAAEILTNRGVADIILLGDVAEVSGKIKELGLSLDVPIIDPAKSPEFADYSETYKELRAKKGISIEQARTAMEDVSYYGTMMVYKDHADGMVSGSINTTAHTIRPSLEFIKTKPGVSIVSSSFLMCLKDRVLVFADCAVNPNPTPEQLASIAISTAHTAKVFGVDARIAMLSYSTGASGKGPDVEAVVEATRIAKEQAPDLLLEGPLQFDAAMDMDVAKTKLPGSAVAGKATVYIFPDLNTGNNTYKAVQRTAGAVAIGPVLQGLNKPVNDLSRGGTVADIVNTVAITAIQAQAEKGLL